MKTLSRLLIVASLLSTPLVAVAENGKPAPFSYYTVEKIRQLASAYISTAGKPPGADPVASARAAEFRGYILGISEHWDKDWRSKCDGPAGQSVEDGDELARQIAHIIGKATPEQIAQAGESRVDVLVGWGVFSRCMSEQWKEK